MQIAGVEVIPISLPFRERYRTASGELDARSMVVVRLRTDDGAIGLGEAVPLSLRGGPGLGQVVTELVNCVPALTGADAGAAASGDPVAIRDWIWELLARCRRHGPARQAIAAFDIALHDLAGRLSGLSAWRLLGATEAAAVACNASIDAAEPGAAAELAGRQREDGYEAFKIKVGSGADHERVAAVRAAVGDAGRLRIDANGAWTVAEAEARLAELTPLGLELAEQPCARAEQLLALRARTPVPIVADESCTDADDAAGLADAAACDAATLKLAKVGGPLEALRIASILPSYLSSALDGPIGIAAGLHTAAALPRGGYADRFAHGLATLDMFAELYASPEGLLGPTIRPPGSAGLGIEIDEAALQRLRIT